MGLCAAWALERRGHEVTVFDQGPVPNPLGSSVDQHRMTRLFYGDAIPSSRLENTGTSTPSQGPAATTRRSAAWLAPSARVTAAASGSISRTLVPGRSARPNRRARAAGIGA